MSTRDHNMNLTLASSLRTVYKRFQDRSDDDITSTDRMLLRQDGLNFLGVEIGARPDLDMPTFRQAIAALLHLNDFRTVQVVGDCRVGFSVAGCRRAREIIHSMLVDDDGVLRDDTVLEYGYTASKYDVNWIVNDIIAATPALKDRTIANVVHMSSVAVERWGYEATGNVSNFVLAYDREAETAFGTDVWLSDSIMSSSAHATLVCVEGGPQAFAQLVNALLQGVAVVIVTGPGMRVDRARSNFSASVMLALLRERFQACINKECMTLAEKDAVRSQALTYLDRHDYCGQSHSRVRYDMVREALDKLMLSPKSLDRVQVEYVP